MKALILDASVSLSWCFPGDPTENTPYTRSILQRLETADAVVPEIWAFEIANGIYVAHARRKRIDADEMAEYLELLQSLPIRVAGGHWLANVRLSALACKHMLSAYDAAYLDLAMKENLPLATSDGAMRAAALAEGVTLV